MILAEKLREFVPSTEVFGATVHLTMAYLGLMGFLDTEVEATEAWFASDRFSEITRLYTARQVVEQRGTIAHDYTVARVAAERFYARLRELRSQGRSITTFGPYSPGQAVAMKRSGIEGIYLGGWATSAKGSITEDPGADLASYPLSAVPDEAAPIVRALLAADRNQTFARSRMSEEERARTPEVDFLPYIIADADTGHGGDAHVRNLVRRFVEVGVPGYHIEDQKPGVKKCGHQGGKVLVPVDEQIKRLNAARFQLDIMGVGGIIVARTDAEAATLLDGSGDERDQPFVLGATKLDVPGYKNAFLAIVESLHDAGVTELNGHLLYDIPAVPKAEAMDWLRTIGLVDDIAAAAAAANAGEITAEQALDTVGDAFVDAWQRAAGLMTYREAVAEAMAFRAEEGGELSMTPDEWDSFSAGASWQEAEAKADEMGLDVAWDARLAKTPEGYYQIQGGIPCAIAKSLAVAPFCDIIWMETKTADLEDARIFAEAIRAVYPDKMMAYNLSPSFNWDTTGMTEDEMRAFPEEIGKLGFVFNFITYGGHQIDGLAAEEFAASLQEDGMLALARLQRKFRLVQSPYSTPQTLVGGPRLDAALMGSSGRTATTKAMGKGSTQFQHLVHTEVPPGLLEEWLKEWAPAHGIDVPLSVVLRPHTPGSEILELQVNGPDETVANVVFSVIHDRRGRPILMVRDQNNYRPEMRRKRLMTLMHLFLIHRYKINAIHFLSPTDDNHKQAEGMRNNGIFGNVTDEVGEIIVAEVSVDDVQPLLGDDRTVLSAFITS